jgi:sialic acid synthase SpsE
MQQQATTKTTIIAEIGVNHNGDLGVAKRLIETAAVAGCDVVKFQTFDPQKLVVKDAATVGYQQVNTGEKSQKTMLSALSIPLDWYDELLDFSSSAGLRFASTGFDIYSVSFLKDLGVPFLKIPSGEITNAPLLAHIARQRLPILLSTGMSTSEEIDTALSIIYWGLKSQEDPTSLLQVKSFYTASRASALEYLRQWVTVLQCTSQYPTPPSLANLKCISTIRAEFGLETGFSDHTLGILAPIIAVSLDATVIEKHITLDRSMPGPDHRASLEPSELTEMVRSIRETELLMGDGIKKPTVEEIDQKDRVRQSIVVSRGMSKDQIITSSDIGTTRLDHGLSAIHYWDTLGRKTTRDYEPGDPL